MRSNFFPFLSVFLAPSNLVFQPFVVSPELVSAPRVVTDAFPFLVSAG